MFVAAGCKPLHPSARSGTPWVPANEGVLAVPTVTLTDRFCSTAKPVSGGRTDYFDGTVQGLTLRVTEHGHRSWCFHYRSPRDGKRARATIGTYPATSLAAARGKALEARGHVEAGTSPCVDRAGDRRHDRGRPRRRIHCRSRTRRAA